jgi:uncharacterized protein (TIGR02996 family)
MNAAPARGFFEAIIATPDDDTPRLAFADWLEEHGDGDRAEFIRVQTLSASLPEWDVRQVRLRLRERELLGRHGLEWKAELPAIEGVSWEDFRRGFVATATFASLAVLGERAAACRSVTPLESALVHWPRRYESRKVLATVAGLREISINAYMIDPDEVGRLADARLLSTVCTLSVRDCGLGARGLRRLLASPHLGNLAALRVPHNFLGNASVAALAEAVSLHSLTEIDLTEAASFERDLEEPVLDAAGMAELVAWPGLARIRSLALSGNAPGLDGLRALLRSPSVANLKELALRDCDLDGRAMEEFRGAFPGLRLDVLNLGQNMLGGPGADHLAAAPCLSDLKVLALDRCEVPPPAGRALAGAVFAGGLRKLRVNNNSLGPEGLRALLEAGPPCLHTLELSGNELDDEAAAALALSPSSDTLVELNLARNRLTADGVLSLARSSYLRSLLLLRLSGNRIPKGAEGLLADSPLGKRLADAQRPPPQVNDSDIPF